MYSKPQKRHTKDSQSTVAELDASTIDTGAQLKHQEAADGSAQARELTQLQSRLDQSAEAPSRLESTGEGVAQRAYIARRPLTGKSAMKPLMDDKEHPKNHGIFHEHIIFEDGEGPGDIGFMGKEKGIAPDKPELLALYEKVSPSYSDHIMRQAVAMNSEPGDYELFGNNCQAWVDQVLQTYRQISGMEQNLDQQEDNGPLVINEAPEERVRVRDSHKTGSKSMKQEMKLEKEKDDVFEGGGFFEL